ncbi:MAG: 3-oxo-tetronate 4-phosphate decarboxylase [Hellea sp.]
MTETKARETIATRGRKLQEAGLTPGSSGNISVRLDDGVLITPTNSRLGELDPADIAKIGLDGRHISGKLPSKETFLHLKMLSQRPSDTSVVHLHSTHSVAVSCMADIDPVNVLPPLTAYYVMRVGTLPLVPYFSPGDLGLADAVEKFAAENHAVLLSNHGPVASGVDLNAAVAAIEEIEETAKLHLMLQGHRVRLLNDQQLAELNIRFKS